MYGLLEKINAVIWGPATLALFIGTGIFLLIRLKGLPVLNIGYAVKLLFKRERKDKNSGDISSFQSLMTSLAACIGTGNIAGVASAMVLGGPGALIWMNISTLLGLSTIFTESLLSVIYRRKNKNGEMSGGPMYVMTDGIGGKTGRIMAVVFSVFAVGASFGIGNMTQSNTVAEALFDTWRLPSGVTGIMMTAVTFLVIVGGIKSIGKFCGIFVPVAAIFYIGCCLAVILCNTAHLKEGLSEMFSMAFSVKSVAGGFGGAVTASIFSAVKWGVARGVFSNEAGLGSAPIAAAAAKTNQPVRQAYIQMTGPVFDTMIMCTLTGLAVAASGVLGMSDENGVLYSGVALTMRAFETVLGEAGKYVITFGIVGFAVPTVVGWAYYGEKTLEFLTSNSAALWGYRIVYSLAAFFGAVKPLEIIWGLADAMNGLMALPNLIAILLLSSQARDFCLNYQKNRNNS